MVHYPEIGDSQLSEGSEEAEEEEGMEEEDEEDEDCEGEDEDDEGEDEDELKKKKGGDSQTKKNTCSLWGVQNLQMRRSYLSKHGGCLNAYTEVEHTCYHFEVKREFLKGALTRFSQFFVSPLVKIEAMERELQAVDSEFNQVLQNNFNAIQPHLVTHLIDSHGGIKRALVMPWKKGSTCRNKY
ncbi:nardilysin-like isoform X2 [Rosa chinensis]|uniref:nardilysin-like isoform X2 n=1 Tax=Rosa chinensis TaxID=74649 RepID=UPI000D08D028|nr:nardilysin-like isoform X2 [Rosa chinensis]